MSALTAKALILWGIGVLLIGSAYGPIWAFGFGALMAPILWWECRDLTRAASGRTKPPPSPKAERRRASL